MEAENHLHIVSFNVPFPANYGGVIDVFHKIRWLKNKGVKVHLHCFTYGRKPAKELESLCEEVIYYPRNTGLLSNLTPLPYIVFSRRDNQLIRNLSAKKYPILFEGLHSCFYINHPFLKNQKKIYRESNIEHDYYAALATDEPNFWKRLYFKTEARRLKTYQAVLKFADLILTVSTQDELYLKSIFTDKKIITIPSFHEHDEVKSKTGKGDYILYHGNLAVAENVKAVEYILENITPKINYPIYIAGNSPSDFLIEKIKNYPSIKLFQNPTADEMNQLIADAQINLLLTFQQTGLKLKLLNALYGGRFCLVNDAMLHGVDLKSCCTVANSSAEIISTINQLMLIDFTESEIAKRKEKLLADFGNEKNIDWLMMNCFEEN